MVLQIPRKPMILRFRPESCGDSLVTEIFADDLARSLWLMIRFGHIVGSDFATFCLSFASSNRCRLPEDAKGLYDEILLWESGRKFFRESSFQNSEAFMARLLRAMKGIEPVKYKIILPNTPEERRYRFTLRKQGFHEGLLGRDPSSYHSSYRHGFYRGARLNRRIRQAPEPIIRYG